MTSNITEYSDLIPEYLNGLLDTDTKALFEEKLANDNALQMELEEFVDFLQLYQNADSEEPQPDDTQFNAILSSIDAGVEKKSRLIQKNKSEPAVMANLLEIWDWLKASFTFPWGVALAQAAVIIFLLVPGTSQDTFKTLSRSPGIDSASPAISVNIVFQKSAGEEEIRKLLLGLGGSIISGPSVQGLYIVQLLSDKTISQTMEILNDSTIISFSKRAY